MLETALLTGPYDWDATLLPRAEFDARIEAVRALLRERGFAGLFVGGTSPEHGALNYLTGFVPKLGPAIAFIPGEGDIRIAFSGGPPMLPSAQRLTFVADVRALRSVEQDAKSWLGEAAGARFALWGDYAITSDVRADLDRAAPSPLTVLDKELDALRRRKTERERSLIARACDILRVTVQTFRAAIAKGTGTRSAALAAERAAYAEDAQDFRILVSAQDGGMPQPLEGTDDPHPDPLLACIAVRFAGYWAEGLVTIASKQTTAFTNAEAALAAVLRKIRPGAASPALAEMARAALAGFDTHPFVAASLGNGIGLSREEAPFLGAESPSTLQEGDICLVRVGAHGGAANAAIVSAMVNVGTTGADVLWRDAG